jgi:hypothetical protein
MYRKAHGRTESGLISKGCAGKTPCGILLQNAAGLSAGAAGKIWQPPHNSANSYRAPCAKCKTCCIRFDFLKVFRFFADILLNPVYNYGNGNKTDCFAWRG